MSREQREKSRTLDENKIKMIDETRTGHDENDDGVMIMTHSLSLYLI